MSAANDGLQSGRHLGEFAELYALGTLEPHERAQVEAHVVACVRCARALGSAEMTVAALDAAFVPALEPPARLAQRIADSARATLPLAPRAVAPRATRFAPGYLAAAAALLVAVGAGGNAFIERAVQTRQAASDSAVVATIATSHFSHISFTARDAGAPVSKVLFARDGAWFYVVIDSATCDCRVVARSATSERDLGKPEVRGSTATLFVRDFPHPVSLALVDAAQHVISGATLVYPAR